MNQPVLAIRDLSVEYADGTWAAREVSLRISRGQCLALVGESGCGKTTIVRAVLGMLPRNAGVQGSILVGGEEVVGASPRQLRRLRGLVAGYVSQDPFAAFNPLMRVIRNVTEAWRVHRMEPPEGAVSKSLSGLGIANAAKRSRLWPHQWSGGMLQRATIAAAAAHRPPLIVADEPTSALDSDLAQSTLAVLRSTGAAILLVCHDLSMVASHADELAVCYAGRIVEIGDCRTVLASPRHPYTAGLLRAIPRPGGGLPEPMDGSPPSLRSRQPGCAFEPRCPLAMEECRRTTPSLHSGIACPVVTGKA